MRVKPNFQVEHLQTALRSKEATPQLRNFSIYDLAAVELGERPASKGVGVGLGVVVGVVSQDLFRRSSPF